MSYLGFPRLHFTGTFLANPSTINNLPNNYSDPTIPDRNVKYNEGLQAAGHDPEKLKALQDEFNSYLSWNPFGTGNFEIQQATVRSFVDEHGDLHTAESSDDPLLGATLKSVNGPSGNPGKLVDLDTDLQVHTRLFGLYLSLTLQGQEDQVLSGYFSDRARLLSLWFGRTPNFRNPDNGAGGAWQAVLQDATWTNQLALSPHLQQLHDAAVTGSGLSVRLTVFGYQNTLGAPNFNLGTVFGTIGPQGSHEPENFLAGRLLIPQSSATVSPMFYAPAETDAERKALTVDLGNSIPVQHPVASSDQVPYDPIDRGTMEAVLCDGDKLIPLGEIDYSPESYDRTAGVFQVSLSKLSEEQLKRLGNLAAGIRTTLSGSESGLDLREAADGLYINVDPATHYMNAGDAKNIVLYARRFGQPAQNEEVPLQLQGVTSSNFGPPPTDTNTPTNAISLPSSVKTDTHGRASFTVVASPLQPSQVPQRRRPIRSQLYFIAGPSERQWLSGNDIWGAATLKLFFAGEAVANPTWADIGPILSQYFALYPFMFYRVGINLSNYDSVKTHAERIRQTMTLPISDGGHMPVTRDMSHADRAIVLSSVVHGIAHNGFGRSV